MSNYLRSVSDENWQFSESEHQLTLLFLKELLFNNYSKVELF